jgi:hypothetical protein
MAKKKITTTASQVSPEAPVELNSKMFRITQSFMKQMRDYMDGAGCGILIRESWINGRQFDIASAAMKLGCYFEYILTGALPKDGKVPQPEFMKSAIAKNKGTTVGLGIDDMYDPYRAAHRNKERVLVYWNSMGLEIDNPLNTKLSAGVKLTKGRFEGTIDVVLRAFTDTSFANGYTMKKGDRILVDLKYSGLLDDKWSVHGWQWTPLQKKYHGTQAKQYNFISNLDPFFMIVDPGEKYVKFFRMILNQEVIDKHIEEGNMLYERLTYYNEMGLLEPRPEVTKCEGCPLFNECEHAHRFPHPVDISLIDE